MALLGLGLGLGRCSTCEHLMQQPNKESGVDNVSKNKENRRRSELLLNFGIVRHFPEEASQAVKS